MYRLWPNIYFTINIDNIKFEGNLPNFPFRPCFKKLFDVVQMYGKDVQAAGSRGTSKFLLDVARQNAEMTINLQRTILNNKQRR